MKKEFYTDNFCNRCSRFSYLRCWISLYKKEQTAEAFTELSNAAVGDIILKTVASGSIQLRHEILIKPQVSGIIGTVLIEPGDTVMTGDVLVEVNIVPNMSALSGAENRLSRAHISLDDAKRTYERNSALFDQGAFSNGPS